VIAVEPDFLRQVLIIRDQKSAVDPKRQIDLRMWSRKSILRFVTETTDFAANP